VTSIRYKGFSIVTRPYQISRSQQWTVDFEIWRKHQRQPFSLDERYPTEHEADARCSGLGRRIIDGRVPGWSVDRLRRRSGIATSVNQVLKGEFMRQYGILGLVLIGIGGFLLFNGGSFMHRENVLKMGDVHVTANERESIPSWVGGVVMLVGAALLVTGVRKRA
jgi:hypothetical protein